MLLLGACGIHDAPVGVSPDRSGTPRDAREADDGYERVDLGTLGGARSYATDINNRDVVVGWSETASGETHAFRWSESQGMVDLGTLPGHTSSQAFRILDGRMPDGGEVIGVSSGPGGMKPVSWTATGEISELSYPLLPRATFSYPLGANTSGAIVGWEPSLVQDAFAWIPGRGKFDLRLTAPVTPTIESVAFAINEDGWTLMVIGDVGGCGRGIPSCWRSFLWHPDSGYTGLGTPDGNREFAVQSRGLNNRGEVAGWVIARFGPSQPVRWSAAQGFTFLPYDAAGGIVSGSAVSINNHGTIVGRVFDPAKGPVSVVWPRTGGFARLDAADPNASIAEAINDRGTVVGWAVVADGINHAVVWKASPGVRSHRSRDGAPRFSLPASTRCLEEEMSGHAQRPLYACILDADRAR